MCNTLFVSKAWLRFSFRLEQDKHVTKCNSYIETIQPARIMTKCLPSYETKPPEERIQIHAPLRTGSERVGGRVGGWAGPSGIGRTPGTLSRRLGALVKGQMWVLGLKGRFSEGQSEPMNALEPGQSKWAFLQPWPELKGTCATLSPTNGIHTRHSERGFGSELRVRWCPFLLCYRLHSNPKGWTLVYECGWPFAKSRPPLLLPPRPSSFHPPGFGLWTFPQSDTSFITATQQPGDVPDDKKSLFCSKLRC